MTKHDHNDEHQDNADSQTPLEQVHEQQEAPTPLDLVREQQATRTPLEMVKEQQAVQQKSREVIEQRPDPSPEVPGASSPSNRRKHPHRQMG